MKTTAVQQSSLKLRRKSSERPLWGHWRTFRSAIGMSVTGHFDGMIGTSAKGHTRTILLQTQVVATEGRYLMMSAITFCGLTTTI